MDERIHARNDGLPGSRHREPRLSGNGAAGHLHAEPVVPADQGISPSLARRLLDVVVAVAVLGLVWPFFLVLAAATRLSTGGTAIYRQRRVGEGGIPFTLYKFRTMRAGMAGPEVTAPGDDRVTRLGR